MENREAINIMGTDTCGSAILDRRKVKNCFDSSGDREKFGVKISIAVVKGEEVPPPLSVGPGVNVVGPSRISMLLGPGLGAFGNMRLLSALLFIIYLF
jgi:hypothetical protein